MLIANSKRLEELNNISNDVFYILTDFDGTITKDNNVSSWGSIFKNPKATQEFADECARLFNHYYKYERDINLSLKERMLMMEKWYRENIEVLIQFGITEEIINYAANNKHLMEFRDGAIDFLKDMYVRNIPIIVISGGVGNIIEQFLINNNCNYPNIFICSNFFYYENGIVAGVRDNNIIHPLNKNENYLSSDMKEKIKDRNNIILLGNSISDIDMADGKKNAFKIGFLDRRIEERLEEFKEYYDIVCTDNTSYDEIRFQVKTLR